MTTLLAVGGGLFLFMIVITAAAERNRVRGTCPTCAAQISLNRIGACSKCGEALRVDGTTFKPVAPGFIPDTVPFMTNLAQLKPASEWTPIWQGKCCVCGGAASRVDRVKIKSIVGQAGPLLTPMNITSDHRYQTEYCGEHTHGFRFAFPPGVGNAKRNEHCLVAIRSVDFYRAFMKVNARTSAN